MVVVVDTDTLKAHLIRKFGAPKANFIVSNIPQRYRCHCKDVPDAYKSFSYRRWLDMYPSEVRGMNWKQYDDWDAKRRIAGVWSRHTGPKPRKISDFGPDAPEVRRLGFRRTMDFVRESIT